jgi:hypothetical protein
MNVWVRFAGAPGKIRKKVIQFPLKACKVNTASIAIVEIHKAFEKISCLFSLINTSYNRSQMAL